MNPYVELGLALALPVLGWLVGRTCARLPKSYWTIAYLVALLIVFLIWLGRANARLEMVAPFRWIADGEPKLLLSGFLATVIFSILLSRVPNIRLRRFVWLFLVVFVGHCCVWPFAAFAIDRNYLSSVQTTIDSDGICRQSSNYDCGPAAAVTALRRLGIDVEEGQLAIAARTSSAMGTPPRVLFETLKKEFANEGVVCEYRHFERIRELREAGLTIAVIRFGPLVDHYVTVLKVADDHLIVGDPLEGKQRYAFDQFERKWRHIGIVLRRCGQPRSLIP